MKKKIAIIGAGIAGLTLANLIKKNSDFEFTVYEKKKNLFSEGGFGIQLGVNSVSILNKIGFDNYDWTFPNDNFKYLTSNTLYANTDAGITGLLAAATTIANGQVISPSEGLYQATLTNLALPIGNQYLYLIYDYRLTSCQEFCYDASSAQNSCCDCTIVYTAYQSSSVQSNSAIVCGQPLTIQYYHTGDAALPVVGNFVYSSSDGAVGTTLPLGLYKISATDFITVNEFGLVASVTTCP